MKSLCYILALCLVVFSSLPCSEAPSEDILFEACEEQDDCSGEADICSPFCACACIGCFGFNLNVPSSYSLAATEYALFTSTTYSFSFYQSFLPPVWQPPQLV